MSAEECETDGNRTLRFIFVPECAGLHQLGGDEIVLLLDSLEGVPKTGMAVCGPSRLQIPVLCVYELKLLPRRPMSLKPPGESAEDVDSHCIWCCLTWLVGPGTGFVGCGRKQAV